MEIVVQPPVEWTTTLRGGLYEKGETCERCGTLLRICITDVQIEFKRWSEETHKPGLFLYYKVLCPHCGEHTHVTGEMSTEVKKILELLHPEVYAAVTETYFVPPIQQSPPMGTNPHGYPHG